MSNTKAIEKSDTVSHSNGIWISLIDQAELDLAQAKERVQGLRSAVKRMKESRDRGDPLPNALDQPTNV